MNSNIKQIELYQLREMELLLRTRMPKSCRLLNVLKIKALNRLPKELFTEFYTREGILDESSLIFSLQYFEDLNCGYHIIVSQPEIQFMTPDVLDALEAFLDWTKPLHVDIEGEKRLLSLFQNVETKRREAGRNPHLMIYDTFAYMMHLEDALKISITGDPIGEEVVAIKPLESYKDIQKVNAIWIQDAKSWQLIEGVARSLPSAGCYVAGNLVSWALASFYGAIIGLATDMKYRGRGFAKRVVRSIANDMAQLGTIPAARTIRENSTAHRIFEAVGFVRTHDTHWIEYSEAIN